MIRLAASAPEAPRRADLRGRFERAAVLERMGRLADALTDYERLCASTTRPDIRQAAERRLAALR